MSAGVNYKIREVRVGKGLPQRYMASKLNISQRAYSKIELGQTKLKWDYLNLIANILEVNIWELIDTTKDDEPSKDKSNFFASVDLLDRLIHQYENEISKLKNEITILKQSKDLA